MAKYVKGQTDFGEIGDERINDLIDFEDVETEEDYKRLVKEKLRTIRDKDGNARGLNLIPHIDEIYEQSKAKSIVEGKQTKLQQEEKESLRKAQKLHAKRKPRGRLADEKTTAKDTRRATKRAVRTWQRRRYRGIDIAKIDTQKAIKLSSKNIITRGDLRLKNVIVNLDKLGRKHYRSKKTGRFISSPFKKK